MAGRVLVVDDSASVRRLVRRALEPEGYCVLGGGDVGGTHARHVRLDTASGRVLVRRESGSGALARLAVRERRTAATPLACGDVVLPQGLPLGRPVRVLIVDDSRSASTACARCGSSRRPTGPRAR